MKIISNGFNASDTPIEDYMATRTTALIVNNRSKTINILHRKSSQPEHYTVTNATEGTLGVIKWAVVEAEYHLLPKGYQVTLEQE